MNTMSKKLTLNIDDEFINFAHTSSRQNSLSISKLFEQYLSKLKKGSNTNGLFKSNIFIVNLIYESMLYICPS